MIIKHLMKERKKRNIIQLVFLLSNFQDVLNIFYD